MLIFKSLSLSLLDRLIVRGLSVDPQLRHHPNVINFNLGNPKPNPLINCKKVRRFRVLVKVSCRRSEFWQIITKKNPQKL